MSHVTVTAQPGKMPCDSHPVTFTPAIAPAIRKRKRPDIGSPAGAIVRARTSVRSRAPNRVQVYLVPTSTAPNRDALLAALTLGLLWANTHLSVVRKLERVYGIGRIWERAVRNKLDTTEEPALMSIPIEGARQ